MAHKRQWWLSGIHHYYFGLLGFIVAFLLLGYDFVISSIVVFILSFIVLIDDYTQHFIQTTSDPKYHSPLHKAYGWLYSRSSLVRWLNGLADKLFGARNNG